MHILLTNDDGIHAPGLRMLASALARLGDVTIVAPAQEQSGVSQKVTFMSPLMAHRVSREGKFWVREGDHWGWGVKGTPADCVKLALSHLVKEKPDVIVSGINGGQNAGISVLYSGTVAAAMEGLVQGFTSIAVSLSYDTNMNYERAAIIAAQLIEQIVKKNSREFDRQVDWRENVQGKLFNINIPLQALEEKTPRVCVVPMDTRPYWVTYEKRSSPRGTHYFWLTGDPDPNRIRAENTEKPQTDLEAICSGFIAVTPLMLDRTNHQFLPKMHEWELNVENEISK